MTAGASSGSGATASDATHLRRAIALAGAARVAGDPPFGSVLVAADGAILGEQRNTTVSDDDVTAHPELKLARWAARALSRESASGSTLFTSCEPCGMCANVIARANIGRVVYALSNDQLDGLKPPGSVRPDAARAVYEGPALFDEARVPVEGFYS